MGNLSSLTPTYGEYEWPGAPLAEKSSRMNSPPTPTSGESELLLTPTSGEYEWPVMAPAGRFMQRE